MVYATQDFCAQYIDEYDKFPYDISSLRLCLERLVIASAPWQSWAMDVRAVYRWENPKTTGKWLALYTVLWYTEHIVSFVVGKQSLAWRAQLKSLPVGLSHLRCDQESLLSYFSRISAQVYAESTR